MQDCSPLGVFPRVPLPQPFVPAPQTTPVCVVVEGLAVYMTCGYEGRAPQVAETAGWCCEGFRPGAFRVMKAGSQKPQAGVMKPGYNISPKSKAGVMKARCVIGVARFGVARFNWQSLRKAVRTAVR